MPVLIITSRWFLTGANDKKSLGPMLTRGRMTRRVVTLFCLPRSHAGFWSKRGSSGMKWKRNRRKIGLRRSVIEMVLLEQRRCDEQVL